MSYDNLLQKRLKRLRNAKKIWFKKTSRMQFENSNTNRQVLMSKNIRHNRYMSLLKSPMHWKKNRNVIISSLINFDQFAHIIFSKHFNPPRPLQLKTHSTEFISRLYYTYLIYINFQVKRISYLMETGIWWPMLWRN